MNVLQKIHKTSAHLFYQQGIVSTGVDQISKESGLSKRTLYKYCQSKEKLALQFLTDRDLSWNDWFKKSVETRFKPGIDRILGLFDILEDWFATTDYRGCAFINTALETTDRRTKQFRICQFHKKNLDQIIYTWLNETNLNLDSTELAFQIGLLIDGAIVRAQLFNDNAAAAAAKTVCKKFLLV